MWMALRFILPLLIVLGGIAWGSSPLIHRTIERWLLSDLQTRSQLVFYSAQDTIASLMMAKSDDKLEDFFRRVAQDERVLALGFCSSDNQLIHHSAGWPKDLGCAPVAMAEQGVTLKHVENRPILAMSYALMGDGKSLGRLVILQDLDVIQRRSASFVTYLAYFFVFLGIMLASVTVLVARLTLRSWTHAVRTGVSVQGPGEGEDKTLTPEVAPLVREMRKMLRNLDGAQPLAEAIRVNWGPDNLRSLLRSELPDVDIIIVSNREPYIHDKDDDGAVVLHRPASGVVTALEPVMRACGGTWIAHGSGQADHLTVDDNDRLRVPPDDPAYTLRRVWLSDEEYEGYYYGFANEGLWPLCHIVFVRPTFRASDWQQYVAVNQKFADAVVAEAKTPNPVVLVQDYHLALLPRLIRERLPEATIVTFWHIPWPNPEVFSICPWKEEILNGLLGSSILGFHTQFHCLNFLESADRFLECHIDREHSAIRAGDGSTLVRPYPISIEWPPSALAAQPPVDGCQDQIRRRFDLDPSIRLAVGVERFDYTKGIADRFRAVESLLDAHPEWLRHFTLLQIAEPTRNRLPVYRDTQIEAETTARRINERLGRDGWVPIILVAKHHEPDDVFTLFRAADLCLVSSLHDGMNLVAKEFIAARDDEDGVLILSTFAGASRELQEALIVNPYDIGAMGEAIHIALTMPLEQRRERMRLMREMVSEYNVHFWAGRMLLDAARMRKRRHMELQIATASHNPTLPENGEKNANSHSIIG